MKDPCKTKKQLIEEVEVLRKQLVRLKKAETKRQRAKDGRCPLYPEALYSGCPGKKSERGAGPFTAELRILPDVRASFP